MQFEITDDTAITFASEFYSALANGFPVDAAVADARKAIYAKPNDVEWGTPVLYMRSSDGVLFSIKRKKSKGKKRVEKEPIAREEGERLEGKNRDIELREKAAKEAQLQAQKEAELLEQERRDREREARLEELSALYSKGIEALAAQDWKTAIKHFNDLLSLDAGYKDASTKLKEAEQQLELAKEKEEKERLRKEEEEKKERERKAQEEAERQKAKQEEERLRRQREEQDRLEREKKKQGTEDLKNVWDNSKQIVNIKTTQYVKTGQKTIEKSGFLGFGKKKELVGDFAEKKVENEVEIRQNSIDMKLVLIPAGEFMMGSDEFEWSKPEHKVKISNPFYLGKYPVTQKEWKAVMGNNPSAFKGDDLPVESVSWNDVQEFIEKLNEKEGTNKYRLPSEAEWEYAVRLQMAVHGKVEMSPSGSAGVVAGATAPGLCRSARLAATAAPATATTTSAFAF